MSGKIPRVNPLAARKALLVSASDYNRAALISDVGELSAETQALVDRAKAIGSLTSVAAMLLSGLTKGAAAPSSPKFAWLPNLLKGAELVTNLWLVFRPKQTANHSQEK
jgi:hypothetical protein